MSYCAPCGTSIPIKQEPVKDGCVVSDTFIPIKLKQYCLTEEYAVSDGCMLLDSEGEDSATIVWSKTPEPNSDRPIDGVRKTPPTWGMMTLCEMVNKLESL